MIRDFIEPWIHLLENPICFFLVVVFIINLTIFVWVQVRMYQYRNKHIPVTKADKITAAVGLLNFFFLLFVFMIGSIQT